MAISAISLNSHGTCILEWDTAGECMDLLCTRRLGVWLRCLIFERWDFTGGGFELLFIP